MKVAFTFKMFTAMAIGISVLSLTAIVTAQQPAERPAAHSASRPSQGELRAFAKAYTEYQRIRRQYEPRLKNAKDAAASKRIQDEANAKVAKALAEQHMSAADYNRIFNLVNADESLRKEVLALVAAERSKS